MAKHHFTALTLLLVAAPTWAAATKPTFKAIAERVQRELQRDTSYQDGDLLVRTTVEGVLKQVKALGWSVPREAELLRRVLADDDFVARTLRSGDGRVFMRDIKNLSGGYDTVDRLARIPRGEATLRGLIRGPDGWKMIQYMATTKGGNNLGQQLAKVPSGGDFNQPTGRIYTAKALLSELQKRYAEAAPEKAP